MPAVPPLAAGRHGAFSGHRGRSWGAAATVVAAVAVAAQLAASKPAAAAPDDWDRLRRCESGGDYSINTGNRHYGAYQFDLPTWRSVGGSGLPSDASRQEQDRRARMLFDRRGWQPWTCAQILGLHGDPGDPARAGAAVPSRVVRAATSSGPRPRGRAPAWIGVKYQWGDRSPNLRLWQLRMKERGYPFRGTGYFGPVTLAHVRMLQERNGLPVTGVIDAATWAAAWTGR